MGDHNGTGQILRVLNAVMEDNSVAIENESVSLSESMEDILHLSNRSYSHGDRLKMCCRPTYRIRKVKNKAAILILVWNFLVASVFYYLSMYPHKFHPTWHMYSITWGLTLPIAGWLTDVYLGRYRVIRWSILIMWIASVLVVASSVLSQSVESYSIDYYIHVILLMIMSFAFGGYQANVVLFGIDQLQDASTDEITSFISWYLFTYYCGGIILYFAHLCLDMTHNSGILDELLVCICLTLMVIFTFLFEKVFLKEPITQNPFQLVYKVIKYAIKNKHPRCRSAFTYCEDELPSRIDFGKHKYGGPFTTEEVENVKTFLRLLTVIFIVSALASGMFSSGVLGNQLILNSNEDFNNFNFTIKDTLSAAYYFGGALLVPLYEFVFHPLLQKHLPCIQNYYWKLSMGAVSQIARIIALMAIDLTARQSYIKHNNITLQCIFAERSGILSSEFDIRWVILPHVLNSVSIITFATGALEFICSQTPYTMRGLLFGVMYGSVVACSVAGYGILQPFTKQSRAWGTRMISCEFWYLLLTLLIVILKTVMLYILMKWYKNRKREDVLPNEQIFAERYYTKY